MDIREWSICSCNECTLRVEKRLILSYALYCAENENLKFEEQDDQDARTPGRASYCLGRGHVDTRLCEIVDGEYGAESVRDHGPSGCDHSPLPVDGKRYFRASAGVSKDAGGNGCEFGAMDEYLISLVALLIGSEASRFRSDTSQATSLLQGIQHTQTLHIILGQVRCKASLHRTYPPLKPSTSTSFSQRHQST